MGYITYSRAGGQWWLLVEVAASTWMKLAAKNVLHQNLAFGCLQLAPVTCSFYPSAIKH